MYRTGTTNTLADTLSRKDQDLTITEARKQAIRSQQLIPADKIDPRVTSDLQLTASDSINAYIEVIETIPLAPMEPMILDHDYASRDEPEPEAEPGLELDVRVLINSETLTVEELDSNSIIAYNIAEYNIIDQVLLVNKSSPSLKLLRQKARE